MVLKHSLEAVVGRPFSVTASGFSGRARLEIFIGGKLVRRKECPDPPCHEMVVIPKGTRGKTITLRAVSTKGEEEEREFVIAGEDEQYLTAGA